MWDLNQRFLKQESQQDDSDDNSDDPLKIVLHSPKPKRKFVRPEPSKPEKQIIESIEDELEQRLDEKAAETKLNVTNIKNIIKQVVTTKHVLGMVKKAEDLTAYDDPISYEQKLTRAKAKELLSTVPIAPVPWSTPKSTSEVYVLCNEDLHNNSSGYEYVPCKKEIEDDGDSSVQSDPLSILPTAPSTPTPNLDLFTQINMVEDGVFKIPQLKLQEETEEEANIAQRTRSKLCINSIHLGIIKESFTPPDITTDMFDMECDTDDWMDFLKQFTRPFDEITRDTEDEEQDPDYNILADEEIDKVDKEELRYDRAVKVTRKELNELIVDFSEFCTGNDVNVVDPQPSMIKNCIIEHDIDIKLDIIENCLDVTEKSEVDDISEESIMEGIDVPNEIEEDDCKNIMIGDTQIPILEQQMRQHVQMLTQNFILTYMHPELHPYSTKLKEYLLNLKFLCEGKERSAFYALNLMQALNLVKYWENLVASNSEEVKQMNQHVEKVLAETMRRKKIGSVSEYIATFPPLILDTISRSEVFLYPSLLPKIPFKSPELFPKYTHTYTDTEDQLIALGLEQFEPLLKHDHRNLTRTGEVKLRVVCAYIQEYMMPLKEAHKLYYHVLRYKLPRCASNPIKYYFQNQKAPPFFHYIHPLDQLQVLPPYKRPPEELPHQWKMHIYPPVQTTNNGYSNHASIQVINNIYPLQATRALLLILPVANNSIVTPQGC